MNILFINNRQSMELPFYPFDRLPFGRISHDDRDTRPFRFPRHVGVTAVEGRDSSQAYFIKAESRWK
jgi:hypothetical protein